MNNAIAAFWAWFQAQADYIDDVLETHPDEIAESISERLKKVHPDLVFDIPFERFEGNRELIVSADGDASLFPLVFELIESAPSIRGWQPIALRPRTDQADQAIDLDGLYLEYEDIFYQTTSDSLPLELDIYIRGYDTKDNRYIHGYFLLLDTLLGEHDAVTYTETVAVRPYDGETSVSRFLELRDLFDRMKEKKN